PDHKQPGGLLRGERVLPGLEIRTTETFCLGRGGRPVGLGGENAAGRQQDQNSDDQVAHGSNRLHIVAATRCFSKTLKLTLQSQSKYPPHPRLLICLEEGMNILYT